MNHQYITASRGDTGTPQKAIQAPRSPRMAGKLRVSFPCRTLCLEPNYDPSVIRKFQTELRWIGKLPGSPYVVEIEKTGDLYGVKVDEEAGYVISTFIDGGLVVSDISDHRTLWSLEEVPPVFSLPYIN